MTFKIIDFIFQDSFRFTAKLTTRYKDLPYYSPPPCILASLFLASSPRGIILLELRHLQWQIINSQSPEFSLWFTLGVVHSMDLGKCSMIGIPQLYGIIQGSFRILQSSVLCLFFSVFILLPVKHWYSYCLSFACHIVSCHVIRILQRVHAKSLQLCPTLCDPMDCSPPGSSVHGILQARVLEWGAVPSPGDLPDPGMEPTSLMSPALAGGFFASSATWEASTAYGLIL